MTRRLDLGTDDQWNKRARSLLIGAAEPMISIIIPTFNERNDIEETLHAALENRYARKEILVIDDSQDNTADIVARFAGYGVKLIRREDPVDGCCGARNRGMTEASGDIVVLLNADVRLPPDFLQRLLVHYSRGADYVLVESRVENGQTLFPRFLQCEHEFLYGDRPDLRWTEGFSCRRSAAVAVGFIPGSYSMRFCRDWMLGERLARAGYRGVTDRSIVVCHRAPEGIRATFRTRRTRGRFSALFRLCISRHSVWRVSITALARAMILACRVVLVAPLLLNARRLDKLSPKGAGDLLPFVLAEALTRGAFCVGEVSTCVEIIFKRLARNLRGSEALRLEGEGV